MSQPSTILFGMGELPQLITTIISVERFIAISWPIKYYIWPARKRFNTAGNGNRYISMTKFRILRLELEYFGFELIDNSDSNASLDPGVPSTHFKSSVTIV